MKKSFVVGEIVKLVNSDGYIIGPGLPPLKGCGLKDIWGIIVGTSETLATVWLFSKKTGQLLSLTEKLHPWSFSFPALEHVEQKERERYNFS
jgi:hypothetical protein